MRGNRAADLSKGVLDALNAFIQDNDGRAPRLIRMKGDDWTFLRDFLKDHREAGFAIPGEIDPAKVGGRENFVLYGVPIVVGPDELEAPEGALE